MPEKFQILDVLKVLVPKSGQYVSEKSEVAQIATETRIGEIRDGCKMANLCGAFVLRTELDDPSGILFSGACDNPECPNIDTNTP